MHLPPALVVAVIATACVLPARVFAVAAGAKAGKNVSAPCAPITADELLRVLGGAFNRRYMAVDQPPSLETGRRDRGEPNGTALTDDDGGGEKQEDAEGFSVPAGHSALLGDTPAWMPQPEEKRNGAGAPKKRGGAAAAPVRGRARRQSAFNPTPWACDGRVLWTDLGPDYFPRFLRSVECAERRCWYDRFACRPRAFAVKVLRRVPGRCAPVPPPAAARRGVAHAGLVPATPAAPTELWLWEERAVAFCCECVSVAD